ncbi:hypothetical protein KP509_21G059000 [Ceratopteris richardii]|uniref:Uncharacterized protein n=1 Tax=Ceratopteris richardii TaxID=49495 RepID=A0A8T2SDH5_CERRI|nr:hypothetical protein KP509_21G059000 [Ceratopteris richardii]
MHLHVGLTSVALKFVSTCVCVTERDFSSNQSLEIIISSLFMKERRQSVCGIVVSCVSVIYSY